MEEIKEEYLEEILKDFERPVAEILYQLQPCIYPDLDRKIPPNKIQWKKDFCKQHEIYISYWDRNYFYIGSDKPHPITYYNPIDIKKGLFKFLVEDAIKIFNDFTFTKEKAEIIFKYNRNLTNNGPPLYPNGHETDNTYTNLFYRGQIKLNLKIIDKIPKLEMNLLGEIKSVTETY